MNDRLGRVLAFDINACLRAVDDAARPPTPDVEATRRRTKLEACRFLLRNGDNADKALVRRFLLELRRQELR